jgi:HK97 family phage major capsid protein
VAARPQRAAQPLITFEEPSMPIMNNRTILEKADLALSDLVAGGGLLKPVQAKQFLQMITKESTLLKQVTAVPMKAPKQEIPYIGFKERILRPRQESVALTQAQRVKPEFSMVELDAKPFIGEVHLSDEQLEDNIEGDNLRQTVLRLIAQRVALDMEDIAINGDVLSTDPTLATMDGLLVQARSHVVDAAGAPLSNDLLHDLLRVMPQEYRRN